MKKLLYILFLVLNYNVFAQTLITFDDLNGSIPNPYNGLNFGGNEFTLIGTNFGCTNGYANNTVSQNMVAFNAFASYPINITSGVATTFTSLYLGAAWNDGLTVQISPIGGAQSPVLVSPTFNGPATLVNLNWSGITGITISLIAGGTTHPGTCGSGNHLVLDNILLNGYTSPTLDEWGLINFTLLVLSLATLFAVQRQKRLSLNNGMQMDVSDQFNFGSILNDVKLNSRSYFMVLASILGIFTLAFGIAVNSFQYEMTSADIPGSIITSLILSIVLHSILIHRKK